MPATDSQETSVESADETDDDPSGLFQYCLEPGCLWTDHWEGGSAADDPALDHLKNNRDHRVRAGADEEHRQDYERQRAGEDVTTEKRAAAANGGDH